MTSKLGRNVCDEVTSVGELPLTVKKENDEIWRERNKLWNVVVHQVRIELIEKIYNLTGVWV